MPFIHFNRLLWNSWGLCQRLCFGVCWRWSLTQFCHLTQKTHTKETLGVSTVSHTTRVFGDYESFSPRHGDARGDARGGSNPTSCQQRDKNSDPPCSLALALAAQSKRNITMQWCWCKMAVSVNDLWTKHMKSNVSISCEKTCLEINFKSWKIQGFSGTPSSLLPEDLGECLFEAENEGDFLGCQ